MFSFLLQCLSSCICVSPLFCILYFARQTTSLLHKVCVGHIGIVYIHFLLKILRFIRFYFSKKKSIFIFFWLAWIFNFLPTCHKKWNEKKQKKQNDTRHKVNNFEQGKFIEHFVYSMVVAEFHSMCDTIVIFNAEIHWTLFIFLFYQWEWCQFLGKPTPKLFLAELNKIEIFF